MDYVLSDKVMLQELRAVIHHTTERGLLAAAKWASELVLSIPKHRRDNPSDMPLPTQPSMNTLEAPGIPQRHPSAPKVGPSMTPEELQYESQLEMEELDYYNAGKALFDNRDFARASGMLGSCRSSKGVFLRVYSDFLVRYRKGCGEGLA
jgi:anaphase-promoting complex subunit 8